MSLNVWHPFTQHGLGEPIPEVARAEGAALFLADGTRIIDAISSWWVQTHGPAGAGSGDGSVGFSARLARPYFLFRQRVDGGGSRAQDGAGLLA